METLMTKDELNRLALLIMRRDELYRQIKLFNSFIDQWYNDINLYKGLREKCLSEISSFEIELMELDSKKDYIASLNSEMNPERSVATKLNQGTNV